MADTLADVVLTGTAYQNLYAATAIAAGTALLIQNKTSHYIRIQIKATTHTASSESGVVLAPPMFHSVSAGESGCWAIGNGPVSVQSTT